MEVTPENFTIVILKDFRNIAFWDLTLNYTDDSKINGLALFFSQNGIRLFFKAAA